MNNEQGKKNNVMNENKGRGLFYGVIAIATFIVMAVGATFAYFTATTESMNAAVQTGSTTLQLKYISYGTAWSKDDLIPADTEVVEYSVEYQNDVTTTTAPDEDGVYTTNGNNTMCKDDYGNSICSIYVFQITNSAASPQTVSLNVVSTINSFSSLNAMAYQISIPDEIENEAAYNDYISTENGNGVNDPLFRTSADNSGGEIDVTDGQGTLLYGDQYTPVYINRKGVVKTLLKYISEEDKDSGTITKMPALDRQLVSLPTVGSEGLDASKRTAKIADNIDINGGKTLTFALVLYIKNENYDQTDTDAEKTFQGQVVVSSGDGSTGVSGTIGAYSAADFDKNTLQGNQSTTQDEKITG